MEQTKPVAYQTAPPSRTKCFGGNEFLARRFRLYAIKTVAAPSRSPRGPISKSVNDHCPFWVLAKYKRGFDVPLDDTPPG
jgi:hypothetical protein